MGRSKDLNSEQVSALLALLRDKQRTMRQIAQQCNLSVGSVHNIKRRAAINQFGPLRHGKCGPKRRTNSQDDRAIVQHVRKQPLATASQIQTHLSDAGVNISRSTVQRRLRALGCRSVKPRRVPKLTSAMMKQRMAFARRYQNWTIQHWRQMRAPFNVRLLLLPVYGAHLATLHPYVPQ